MNEMKIKNLSITVLLLVISLFGVEHSEQIKAQTQAGSDIEITTANVKELVEIKRYQSLADFNSFITIKWQANGNMLALFHIDEIQFYDLPSQRKSFWHLDFHQVSDYQNPCGANTIFTISPDWTRVFIPNFSTCGNIDLLDSQTGKVVFTITMPQGWIPITINDDTSKLLLQNSQGNLEIENLNTSTIIKLQNFDGGANNAVFSPDNTLVALGDAFGRVFIWDTNSGKLQQAFERTGFQIISLTFSHNRKILAAFTPHWVDLYNLNRGRMVNTLYADGQYLQFSQDDQVVATADTGQGGQIAIKVWDARTEVNSTVIGPLYTLLPAPHDDRFANFMFDSYKNILVTYSSGDGFLEFYNFRTGERLRQMNTQASSPIYSVAFNPQGTRLAYMDSDGVIHILAVRTP